MQLPFIDGGLMTGISTIDTKVEISFRKPLFTSKSQPIDITNTCKKFLF